jgi:hypothetical protein
VVIVTHPVPYIPVVASPLRALPPYQSQQGNGVLNDCGPACALMLARWVGRGMDDSVAYWSRQIDAAQDGTTAQDLARMFSLMKLTPLVGMATPLPRIELVRYNKLPVKNPTYADDTFLHWIVRLSDTTYHDPLWTGNGGANLTATKAQIDAAIHDVKQSVGIVERPQGATMAEPARTKYDRVYHVINADATEEQAVEIFRKAFRTNRQTVGFSYDDAGIGDGLQSKRAILYGIPSDKRASFTAFFAQWYPSVSVEFAGVETKPPVTPPVVPPSGSAIGKHPALPALPFNKRLGVHTLERVEEAREAFNLGCRAFTIMNNLGGAREIRQMGAAVIVRHYMPIGQLWSVYQFITAFGVNANDSFIIMGINEADNISTSDIERRFAYEREWALKMHTLSPKSFIVIGGFSMGTPQIDDANVAARFRSTYAAFLNANADWCGLNYHSYHRRHSSEVPPATEKVEDPAWWPKRFLNWGYNPQFGGLNSNVVMVSDEAGVDIGGIGGFPPCGYNDNTFLKWHAMQRAWFESVPQVYIQNVFQFSPREDWAGYYARVVLGGMTQVWQGTAPASREVLMPEVYEGEAPGADWSPPAKDMGL